MADNRGKRFYRPAHWTLARILAHYSEPGPNGCVLWTGALVGGYGHMFWGGRMQRSHRLAWEVANGPIPPGLFACHTCDVRACINPAHLWLGNNADNTADRNAKGRQPRGEKHGLRKLTGAQALAIYRAVGRQRAIAAAYGTTQSIVSEIKGRKIWRHLHGS